MLSETLPATGVTAFLPTAVSWPTGHYPLFFEALEDAEAPGARILGAHVEGPFLSPARKGAHNPNHLIPVDPGLIREFASSGVVSMLTLAPELAGAKEAIRLLSDAGIVVSAGHTDATYEQIHRAAGIGLSMATHLYNAMSPMRHREPGTVGAVLVEDGIRTSIIADGVHVHEGALRLAYRAKGPESLVLVTDAAAAAGMPDGEYELSGRTVRLDNGSVRLPDGTLAGSALTMDQAVRNAVRFLGIPLEDAVRMVSETPAKVLGLSAGGRVVKGADADLTILSQDGVVEETIVAGESAYSR
jgi:N-acetylglucosamine-6-phosphate deacetylase